MARSDEVGKKIKAGVDLPVCPFFYFLEVSLNSSTRRLLLVKFKDQWPSMDKSCEIGDPHELPCDPERENF